MKTKSEFVSNIREAIEEAKEINREYHYFSTICEDMALSQNDKGRLSGYIISIKDGINIKGVEGIASSRILKGYLPLFDATAVERIKKEGGIIVGKTVQDEFGFGNFATNVGLGIEIPLNPLDKARVTGGSSGGCAGIARKSRFRHISLAESTGGSIVCPSSFCGVVGLCPTYGRVSRYGLIDYANSLDKIGPIAKNVYDAALLLGVIAGDDGQDSTCSDMPVDAYTEYVGKDISGIRIGLIKESLGAGVDKRISECVRNKAELLRSKGAIVEEVSLPLTQKYSLAVYYMIAASEASTNLAKYCGMRYGVMEDPSGIGYNDYFEKVRSNNFNNEAKRRIILGTFARMSGFRDACYIKAAKIRTKIIDEYRRLFERYSVLLSPTMPVVAPRFDEVEKMSPLQSYMMDNLLVGPNLAGLPHITVPSEMKGGMPIGTLIIADHFQEKTAIQVASAIEEGSDGS